MDTAFDPDADAAPTKPEPSRRVDVLRQVLGNVGAEKSATQAIADEWSDAHSVERPMAEYRTIARAAPVDRYRPLLRDCLVSVGPVV